MYYAAICAIVKDELKDIREWLFYHLAIGVEHFLIYDNNSQVSLRSTLAPFIDANLVTVVDISLTEAQQLTAYLDALRSWGGNTRWLAFIDIDEFILPLRHDDVRDFLDDYRDYGGVCANWCKFSSNGHIGRPAGGILENYTRSMGLTNHIKSIVQPAAVLRPASPHHFLFKPGNYCVNEDKIPVRDFHTYAVADKIRINHYYFKSQQDFYDKMARGFGTKMKNATERRIDIFYNHLGEQSFHDDAILRFRDRMAKLSRFPLGAVADAVHNGKNRDLLAGMRDIDECLASNQMARAAQLYKVLSRYHEAPELNVLGANIAFLQGCFQSGLELLRREMSRQEADAEILRLCYGALGNYYALSGRKEENALVRQYLR